MKKCLFAALALMTTPAAAEPTLSAHVTRWQVDGRYVNLLLVVDNKSDRTFGSTKWSRQFLNKGEPVGEASFYVDKVEANKQTSKSSVTSDVFYAFDTAECRLLQAC